MAALTFPSRRILWVALALCLTTLVVDRTGAFRGPEELTLAWRYALRGRRPAAAPVVIAAIDEASLRRFGQFPWDRHLFARLLDRLGQDGVSAVVFDVAFDEPGRQAPGEDAALLKAMGKVPHVILPIFRAYGSGPAGQAGEAESLVVPISLLADRASGLGLAQFRATDQRDVEEVDPMQRVGDRVYPTLGEAAAIALGAEPQVPSLWWQTSPLALDYLGPRHSILTYPIVDLLAGSVPSKDLRGKVVLVGATATGLPDTGFTTPFGTPMPGVEIHATVIENLLGHGPLRRPSFPVFGLLLAAIALFPGTLLLSPRATGWRRFGILLVALGGLGMVAMGLFRSRIWLPVIPIALLLFACAVAGTAWQAAFLIQERSLLLGWYAEDLKGEARRQRAQLDGELHDETQQLIVVLLRELRRMRKGLAPETDTEVSERLSRCEQLGDRMLEEVHRIRRNLVPRTLEQEGLVSAIHEMVKDFQVQGLTVRVSEEDWPPEASDADEELYWLVKEALNNAQKHARARQVEVTLDATGRQLVVTVSDDGQGFRPGPLDRAPAGQEHTGLHRMWVRARAMGGELSVESSPGAGATLRVRLPRERRNNAPRWRVALMGGNL